jgi:hypothetical protein
MHGATILGSDLPAECERIVRRFEEAWGGPEVPELDSFLPTVGPASPQLLLELVHVDLDFRLRRGELARIENYLGRLPLLGLDRAALVDLIVAEYTLRGCWGAEATLEEYLHRFPQLEDTLRARLCVEGGNPGRPPQATPPPMPSLLGRPNPPGYDTVR